jgi:hypothetical protein
MSGKFPNPMESFKIFMSQCIFNNVSVRICTEQLENERTGIQAVPLILILTWEKIILLRDKNGDLLCVISIQLPSATGHGKKYTIFSHMPREAETDAKVRHFQPHVRCTN